MLRFAGRLLIVFLTVLFVEAKAQEPVALPVADARFKAVILLVVALPDD